MTLFNSSLLTRRARLSRLLPLGLLAVLAGNASALSVPQRVYGPPASPRFSRTPQGVPAPYLAALGALPLRFAPAPAAATARPVPLPVQTDPVIEPAVQTDPEPADESKPEPDTPVVPVDPEVPEGQKPVSILPDDTVRNLRAEDVLPYFQLPSDMPDGEIHPSVIVPFTPGTPSRPSQPPSSATYQLK
jgi:hypothetical protein